MMENFLQALGIGSFLSLATERIVAAIMAPIKKKWPDVDYWWLIYPSWLLGSFLAYAAGINLLLTLVPNLDPFFGRILTAVIVGGGANLIHDIFDKPPTTSITTTSNAPGVMTATVSTDSPPAGAPTPWLPGDHEPITQNAPVRPIKPR
jgi:hypothetical protein